MFRMKFSFSIYLLAASLVLPALAQQPSTAVASNAVVPPFTKFSGNLTDINGKPVTGVTGVTFSLYKDAEGGVPLWIETQNVHADKNGHYTIDLGASKSQGLPSDLFSSGQARWIGVQAQGQSEKPRVLLMSVPYALKAMDAETLGGQPASAFLQASQAQQNGINPPIVGNGHANYITRWLTSQKLGNSSIFESPSGNIGIGTTAPGGQLDVNGAADIRGALTLFPSQKSTVFSINGSGFNIASSGNVSFIPSQTFPGVPSLSASNAFTAAQTITANVSSAALTVNNNSSTGTGLNVSNGFIGVYAAGDALPIDAMTSTGPQAVYAENDFDTNSAAGVLGAEFGTKTRNVGVYGYSASNFGYGVYGLSQQVSGLTGFDPAGVWGDTYAGNGVLGVSFQQIGVLGITADSIDQANPAGYFDNISSQDDIVVEAIGENVGGGCLIMTTGDLQCTGSKSAVVPVDNGARKVALYAIESPQNWFEDFGSGRLSHGSTTIRLESVFAQTVNTGVNYHIYLTPNGECEGLFVSQKTPTSFEVHELHKGTSNVSFDYRIVAERKGYESVRLADRTKFFTNQTLAAKGLLKKGSVPVMTIPQAQKPMAKVQPVSRAAR